MIRTSHRHVPVGLSAAWVLAITSIGCNWILFGKSHASEVCRGFSVFLNLMKLISEYEIALRTIFKHITFICVIHLLQNQLKNKLPSSKLFFIGHTFQ